MHQDRLKSTSLLVPAARKLLSDLGIGAQLSGKIINGHEVFQRYIHALCFDCLD